MNARDSEFVMGLLLDSGFRKADSFENAGVIIFNSCSVRKHAEDKLFSNIGDLAGLKKKNADLVIGLMGCTAQSRKSEAFETAPLLDFICGPGNESDLPQIIGDILKDRCRIVAADKINQKRPELFFPHRENAFKTFVSIGEGCDNFCSYCIVPYVRGRERSRDAKDITREVKDLAARGFKEITLLGQNVNSYKGKEGKIGGEIGGEKGAGFGAHGPENLGRAGLNLPYHYGVPSNFIRLLERLNKINGIERIRFMTSHPKDASCDLFKAMRDLEKVCEHLHLPLQSGSDRILKLMNRKYTQEKYRKLIADYKKILPEGALTTDIIIGFPFETEGDFRRTVKIVEEIAPDSAFTFKYSPRQPAKSCKLKDNVSDAIKERRLKTIIDLQCKIAGKRNAVLIDKTVEILVDGRGNKDPRKLSGRTRTNKATVFAGDARLIGKLVDVKIESVSPYALKGRLA